VHSKHQLGNSVSRVATTALVIATLFQLTVVLSQSAQSQNLPTSRRWTETVLHNFSNGTDGVGPFASLLSDATGNLYGTTFYGGSHGNGTVFELKPPAGGGWSEVVYSFSSGSDDPGPYGGLVFDAAGNLYGTTVGGGTYGGGTAFELAPAVGGGWTEQVLHSFGTGTDGRDPFTGLTFDAAGNLYGTTFYGGGTGCSGQGCGTVFELTPAAGGGWSEQVVHSFGNGTDGAQPYYGMIFQAGNLYGTTTVGGTYGRGAIVELTPTAGGGWSEVVYSFGNGMDGSNPYGGLIFDAAGNLYGTTVGGGTYGGGTVFEMTFRGGEGWNEQVLYSFDGNDGTMPFCSLIFDAAGNLYGTTSGGGTYCGERPCGTVFELTPTEGGGWTETVLHNFGNGTDGASPYAGLLIDTTGNLYGTNVAGGTGGVGTVFKLTPVYPCVKCSHSVLP
jgi:uncharacterized repeat protein (TIGR03803 family)